MCSNGVDKNKSVAQTAYAFLKAIHRSSIPISCHFNTFTFTLFKLWKSVSSSRRSPGSKIFSMNSSVEEVPVICSGKAFYDQAGSKTFYCSCNSFVSQHEISCDRSFASSFPKALFSCQCVLLGASEGYFSCAQWGNLSLAQQFFDFRCLVVIILFWWMSKNV